MVPRPLGRTGLMLSPIGFGAFKIGRNQGIKYAHGYPLPTEQQTEQLIRELLDAGINYIDTAPAYGTSEERIGRALASVQPMSCVISTKAGETFEAGVSRHDFSTTGILTSLDRSRQRIGRESLDLVFIHSDGNDLDILRDSPAVAALEQAKGRGLVRNIGFSGKTSAGASESLAWADAIMVEYHLEDRSHEAIIAAAAEQGVGVVVKKGLASGRLDPERSIRFVLETPGVTSMVIGGLSAAHMRQNITIASSIIPSRGASARGAAGA